MMLVVRRPNQMGLEIDKIEKQLTESIRSVFTSLELHTGLSIPYEVNFRYQDNTHLPNYIPGSNKPNGAIDPYKPDSPHGLRIAIFSDITRYKTRDTVNTDWYNQLSAIRHVLGHELFHVGDGQSPDSHLKEYLCDAFSVCLTGLKTAVDTIAYFHVDSGEHQELLQSDDHPTPASRRQAIIAKTYVPRIDTLLN